MKRVDHSRTFFNKSALDTTSQEHVHVVRVKRKTRVEIFYRRPPLYPPIIPASLPFTRHRERTYVPIAYVRMRAIAILNGRLIFISTFVARRFT